MTIKRERCECCGAEGNWVCTCDGCGKDIPLSGPDGRRDCAAGHWMMLSEEIGGSIRDDDLHACSLACLSVVLRKADSERLAFHWSGSRDECEVL